MTAAFTSLCAAGSGKLEFRLVLEGADVQIVSSEEMAGSLADGRSRIPGLRRDGLGFSERVYIAGAEHDAQINQITIDEVPGQWLGEASRLFTTIAQRICPLASTLSTSGVALVPDNAADLFTVGEFYHLGTETVKVTAKDAGASPEELTLDRAQWGTTAQEHPVSSGEAAQASEIYDEPTGWKGRRCWLYAHTQDELTTSDEGTIVWRGVLAREPALAEDDALSWSLAVEPRTRALEASLAGGFDEGFNLRGIYYPGACPFEFSIRRYTTASPAVSDAVVIFRLAGFWETQEEFCAAVTALVMADATVTAWGVDFTARPLGQTWDLVYTTPAADPRYVGIFGGSRVDGMFDGALLADPVTVPGDRDHDPTVPVVAASTSYVVRRLPDTADFRSIPRANYWPGVPSSDSDVATYPVTRIYLDRLGALSTSDDLVVTPQFMPGGHLYPADAEIEPQTLRVYSVTSATSSVLAAEGGIMVGPRIIARGETQPTITGAARYASGDGDVADLRDDLITRAPTVANRGRGPWVTSDDLASWTDAVAEASAGRAWLDHRVYTFVEPVKAIEVLREEWKLYGLIPYLDADAKLAVRQFTLGGTTVDLEVGDDEILVDETLGSVTGEADGIVTVVKVLSGYDPAEDKHTGREFTFRGMSAIARVHEERTLEIAPRSRAVGAESDWPDLQQRAWSLITLFGNRRTQCVTVEVSLAAWGLLVGDVVSLTVGALPSDGGRTEWGATGMAARKGIVIGRSWDLGAGAGSLDVLLHELDVAGYTPSARVTGASGASTTWDLTVTQTHYARTGVDDSSHFAVGQAVRLIEWDASSPTIREGTVTSVAATTIGVELSAAWGGMGGATYYTLIWDTSADAETTATQLQSAYQAGASGRITLASGSNPAQVYAP